MKSDENQYISTRNQLQSSEAAPEDARCTPIDISPKRVSSNCQSPIVPLSCRCVASVRLERCDDCQVLQGVTSIKTEDHTAEIHSQEGCNQKDTRSTDNCDYWQIFHGVTVIKSEEPLAEGFLPPDKTCHQKDRRPKKPHIQVKSETTESDECSSNPSTSRAEEGIILSSVVCGEEDRGALTDFQTSVLLRLQSLEEAQMEMLQLLRSFVGVNKAAEELDDVLPASTHEELGMLCERLSCQVFKKQLTCYLTSLGGQNIGDSVRRMLRKIGTNALWCGYSLKGKKGKIAFIDLPVARVINRACLVNHPKARIYEVETEMAECLKHAPNKRGGPKYKPPPPKRIKHIKSSASSSPSDTDD